jgi:hypothetical protein
MVMVVLVVQALLIVIMVEQDPVVVPVQSEEPAGQVELAQLAETEAQAEHHFKQIMLLVLL